MRITLLASIVLLGCTAVMEPVDAGGMDAGREDAGREDGGRDDAGRDDAGRDDAGMIVELDAGQDAGMTEPDAGRMDAGMVVMVDAGRDAGMIVEEDAGRDAGMMDAGRDAGMTMMTDAGRDAGTTMMTDAGRDAGMTMCTAPEGPLPFTGCNPTMGIECDGDWAGRCSPACSASQCCSPQMNRFACVPRNADGSCPAADLWIDASRVRPSISTMSYSTSSCEYVEGCIAGTGARRLLRFDTWTPNTGGADMYLGPPGGSSYFEYSSCHAHYHFNTYAEYELLTADGRCVAAEGHKQAFCLLDYYDYPCDSDPSTPTPACSRLIGRGAYTCSNQGIRRDAQDVYSSTLDCQWVDITGVPPGNYLLRIRINTEHILNESDYTNNEVRVPVTIP